MLYKKVLLLFTELRKKTKTKSTVIRTADINICHCLLYHLENYELIQNYLIFCLIVVTQQTTPTSAGRAYKHDNCRTLICTDFVIICNTSLQLFEYKIMSLLKLRQYFTSPALCGRSKWWYKLSHLQINFIFYSYLNIL